MYKNPCIVPTTFTTPGRPATNCRGTPTKTRMMSKVAVVKAITRYSTRSGRGTTPVRGGSLRIGAGIMFLRCVA
jgi:hypothetical protein